MENGVTVENLGNITGQAKMNQTMVILSVAHRLQKRKRRLKLKQMPENLNYLWKKETNPLKRRGSRKKWRENRQWQPQ